MVCNTSVVPLLRCVVHAGRFDIKPKKAALAAKYKEEKVGTTSM
jgi:hypothetical protein